MRVSVGGYAWLIATRRFVSLHRSAVTKEGKGEATVGQKLIQHTLMAIPCTQPSITHGQIHASMRLCVDTVGTCGLVISREQGLHYEYSRNCTAEIFGFGPSL